jgi:16S rRNA (uracil1498-N3)-methyltransferase
MRITRVHVDSELEVGAEIALAEAQSHYLKHVLRLKPGAALLLFDGRQALEFRAILVSSGKKLSACIESATEVATESSLACEIIQGLARADHTDWTIQKTTELGVSKITLFNAERTQMPVKPAQLEKKMKHWRGVAISACEQSGRTLLPEISFHAGLTQALTTTAAECKLLLDFSAASLASSLDRSRTPVSILLGPEGGLNSAEIDLARSTGFVPVSLGPRVLRTETAAASALAVVQSLLGDMR